MRAVGWIHQRIQHYFTDIGAGAELDARATAAEVAVIHLHFVGAAVGRQAIELEVPEGVRNRLGNMGRPALKRYFGTLYAVGLAFDVGDGTAANETLVESPEA